MGTLEALKQNWNRFVLFAASLCTLFSTFVVLPPAGGGEKLWYRYGSFLVALLTGLWFLPVKNWCSRSAAWYWWAGAGAFAILSATAFISYNDRLERWTVPYWRDRRAVVGEHLTDDARVYRSSSQQYLNDLQLLKSYAGNAEAVWRSDEIYARQQRLALLYLATLLALASAVVTVAQAAYCLNNIGAPAEPGRRGQ